MTQDITASTIIAAAADAGVALAWPEGVRVASHGAVEVRDTGGEWDDAPPAVALRLALDAAKEGLRGKGLHVNSSPMAGGSWRVMRRVVRRGTGECDTVSKHPTESAAVLAAIEFAKGAK